MYRNLDCSDMFPNSSPLLLHCVDPEFECGYYDQYENLLINRCHIHCCLSN